MKELKPWNLWKKYRNKFCSPGEMVNFMSTWLDDNAHVYINLCVCVRVSVGICVYIHTNTYIYSHTHTHISCWFCFSEEIYTLKKKKTLHYCRCRAELTENQTQNLILWVDELQHILNFQHHRVSTVKVKVLTGKKWDPENGMETYARALMNLGSLNPYILESSLPGK